MDATDCISPSWTYFMADLHLLEYYYKKYKSMTKEKTKNKPELDNYIKDMREKYVALYCSIISKYKSHYDRIFSEYYKFNYKYTNIAQDEEFLYDLMTLNEELIYYDFVALNSIKADFYKKLIFCYKNYLDGWVSKDILYRLRKERFNNIFINFINEYAAQSDLPQVLVLCYFYPLEEEINKTCMELTKLNQYFSRIDVMGFLKKQKDEKEVYIKETIIKRINLIDKWVQRIKEKILDDTIYLLSIPISQGKLQKKK